MRETGSVEKGCLVSMAALWFGATGSGDRYHRATECPHLVEPALARRRPSWASSPRPLSKRKPRFVVARDFFLRIPTGWWLRSSAGGLKASTIVRRRRAGAVSSRQRAARPARPPSSLVRAPLIAQTSGLSNRGLPNRRASG